MKTNVIYVLVTVAMVLIIIAPGDELWSWSYWIPMGTSFILILTAIGIALYGLYKQCRMKTENDE